MQEFLGGLFDYRVLSSYKYINIACCWVDFSDTENVICGEYLTDSKKEEAQKIEVWTGISNCYVLQVLGLRAEFYKMVAEDHGISRLVLPVIENWGRKTKAHDLDEVVKLYEKHMETELMKVVIYLGVTKSEKRSPDCGEWRVVVYK